MVGADGTAYTLFFASLPTLRLPNIDVLLDLLRVVFSGVPSHVIVFFLTWVYWLKISVSFCEFRNWRRPQTCLSLTVIQVIHANQVEAEVSSGLICWRFFFIQAQHYLLFSQLVIVILLSFEVSSVCGLHTIVGLGGSPLSVLSHRWLLDSLRHIFSALLSNLF